MEKDKIIALLAILAVVSVALNIYQYIAYQNGKVEVSYSESGAATATKPYARPIQQTLQSDSALITVTSPNGGESWASGSQRDITWLASPSIRTVDVSVVSVDPSCTSGASCPPIVNYSLQKQVGNTGAYSWTIAIPSGNSYKVLITNSANPATKDLSDQNFSVTPPPTNATISLSADKQSGSVGLTVTFTATVTGNPSPITLFFGSYTPPGSTTTYTYGAAEPCTVTFGGTSCTNLTPNRTFTASHTYNHPPGIYEALATGSSSGNSIKSNTVKIEIK